MKSEIHESPKSKLLRVSRKLAMLLVVLLGTNLVANANTVAPKEHTSKEVKVIRKHKKAKKAHAAKTEAAKPIAKVQK